MGALYGNDMTRYAIDLLARFRRAKNVRFGILDWFEGDLEIESVESDADSDYEEALIDTEKPNSSNQPNRPAEEPMAPEVFNWDAGTLDLPLMGASTIFSCGYWPRMRQLTLTLAVPNMWPGTSKLEIVTALAHTLSRISVLFPLLVTLRISTSTALCDPAPHPPSATKEGTPMGPTLYPAALTSLGPKALVPPLAFLRTLEVRNVPKVVLLKFASQWTCLAKEHDVRVKFRPVGRVAEGGDGQWADFSVELARWVEIYRENYTEVDWERSCYCHRSMTGKTREGLVQVVQLVHIKVTVKE
jgi:hypothetical protein